MPTIFRDPVEIDSFLFNDRSRIDGAMFNVDLLDGWDDSPEPTVVVGQFAFSDGVVTADRFPYKEKYIEVGGWVHTTSRLEAERAKSKLRALFNPNKDIFLIRRGPIPQGYWVRPSTRLEFPQDIGREGFRWLVQVMAEWPFRIGVEEKSGVARPFIGASFYRLYEYKSNTARRYAYNAETDTYYRTYFESIEGEGGDVTATVYRTNLHIDPGATQSPTSTTPWATSRWFGAGGGAGNYTSGTGGGLELSAGTIDTFARKTWTTASTSNGDTGFTLRKSATEAAFPVTPGEMVAASGYLRTSSPTEKYVKVRFLWWDSAGALIQQTSNLGGEPITSVDGWHRITGVESAPANAVTLTVVFDVISGGTPWAAGETLDGTAALIEKNGIVEPFFYGETLGTPSIQYIWTGTPHNSTSQLIQYTKTPDVNPIPDTILIENAGDVYAYPTMEVQGPLPAGTWHVQNDTTGEILSFDSTINDNQVLVIDNLHQTASIDGVPVDYYIRGSWLRLAPGINQIRLVSGADAPGATLTVRTFDTWS